MRPSFKALKVFSFINLKTLLN